MVLRVRALLVTDRLPVRRSVLTLLPEGAGADVVAARDLTGQQVRGADVVVVDGPVPDLVDGSVAALHDAVVRGALLLAVGSAPPAGAHGSLARLLGAAATPPRHPGASEVFATVAGPPSALTERTEDEFPVVDVVATLVPLVDDLEAVLTCSIGFSHRLVVATRGLGRGRVVVSTLGTTDAALAAPALRRTLQRSLAPPPSARRGAFGVGIVGYGPHGGMGEAHGRAATAVEGLELVAAVDPDGERRKAAEQRFPGIRTSGGVDDLLDDGDVEVAIIATPPSSHASLALRLLRAGKHVALEKPMCLTVAEADELMATAAAEGRTLTVHQNRRWDPDFLAVRRAVDGGLLGEVFNVETFVGGFEHPCRAWHSEDTVSGGAVYDWGSHHVDWILQLLGSTPATVTTTAHKRVWHDVTNLDQLRVRMSWADGREAQFLQSDIAAVRPPKFWVQGTAGTLVGHYRQLVAERVEPGRGYVREESHHAEAPAAIAVTRYESGYGLTETALPPVPVAPFPFHRNLADHLHLGEPLAVGPASVRAVVAVLEASHGAGATGGTTALADGGSPVRP
jgi:predicted dehydrogenase